MASQIVGLLFMALLTGILLTQLRQALRYQGIMLPGCLTNTLIVLLALLLAVYGLSPHCLTHAVL